MRFLGWGMAMLAVATAEVLCGLGVAAAPWLTPLLLVGAALVVGVLLKPGWGYLLAVFLLIFPHLTVIPGRSGSGGIEAVHLAVLLTVCGWLATGLLSADKRVRIFGEPLTPPLTVFMGWAAFTLWWAPDFGWSAYLWLQVVFGFVFYLLGTRLLASERLLKAAAIVWMINGAVLVVLQLMALHVPGAGGLLTGTVFRSKDFLAGTRMADLMQPNVMALYLNLSLVMTLAVFLSIGKYRRLLPTLALLAIALMDLLTFSRGGLIGLVVGLGVFLIYSRELRRAAVWLGLPAIALVLAVFLSNQNAAETFSKRASAMTAPSEIGAMQIRLKMWGEVKRLTLLTDGLGVGVGGFIHDVSPAMRSIKKDPTQSAYSHPHSTYLMVVTELGLMGLAILGWIGAAAASGLRRALRRPTGNWERNVALGFMAGFLAVAVQGLIDLVYYDRLIWAFMGMGGAALNLAPSGATQAAGPAAPALAMRKEAT